MGLVVTAPTLSKVGVLSAAGLGGVVTVCARLAVLRVVRVA